jgi:hypothetical protein
MDLDAALAFARSPRNGRPQSSNVIDAVGDDDTVRVSITADRVKYKNLVRVPRCRRSSTGTTLAP